MADNDSTQASTPAATSSVTKAASPGYILVVRHAFGDYQVGEEITDTATIKEVLEGEQAIYVIKRAA